MKKLMSLLLAAVMLLSFAACSGNGGKTAEVTPEPTEAPTAEPTEEPTEAPTPEPTEEPIQATEISIGQSVSLPFVEMEFSSYEIKPDIRQSIKSGIVTRTFGPQPESGKQFIAIFGTIKNLSNEALPVYDFFAGEYNLDGYKYECSANDCFIYNENGETYSMLDPLITASFMIYVAVPNELANAGNITFRFGFYDQFDNKDLSRNRAFEEDPISLCPYQYIVKIK